MERRDVIGDNSFANQVLENTDINAKVGSTRKLKRRGDELKF